MIKIQIVRVGDSHGNRYDVVVPDPCKTIQVWGMRDKEGIIRDFDDKAYHIKHWADCFGFGVEIFDLDVYIVDDLSMSTHISRRQI